jgi:hypothetical protein
VAGHDEGRIIAIVAAVLIVVGFLYHFGSGHLGPSLPCRSKCWRVPRAVRSLMLHLPQRSPAGASAGLDCGAVRRLELRPLRGRRDFVNRAKPK